MAEHLSADQITISEDLQALGKELGKIAKRYGLRRLSGTFSPGFDSAWRPDVNFFWSEGRHGEDAEKVSMQSTHSVVVKVTP